MIPCESVHLIRKNGARIQEQLPAPAQRRLGGLGGVGKIGLSGKFFSNSCLSVRAGRRSRGEDRLDRSGAFERARCWGIRVGIDQGKIVDCRGCLGVRMLVSVGYRVGNEGKKKKKDLRLLVSPRFNLAVPTGLEPVSSA